MPDRPDSETEDARFLRLLPHTQAFVKRHMAKYDSSHDYNHVLRVVHQASNIADASTLPLRKPVVILAAYLHDVDDRKYKVEGDDSDHTLEHLKEVGHPDNFARTVSRVAHAVSYSSEVKDPVSVQSMLELHPELGPVQDADRLDAIGAIGVARCFVFGATQQAQSDMRSFHDPQSTLDLAIKHYGDKLERLEGMMKTDMGRKLARERTRRLKQYKSWFLEETSIARESTFSQ